MYVYIRAHPPDRLWTVGFYDPSGQWHAESDHQAPEEAAARVAYLNGGGRLPAQDGGSYDDYKDRYGARRCCHATLNAAGKSEYLCNLPAGHSGPHQGGGES